MEIGLDSGLDNTREKELNPEIFAMKMMICIDLIRQNGGWDVQHALVNRNMPTSSFKSFRGLR